MLSRNKSIFHLGEEGGEATTKTASSSMKWPSECAQGLRIVLIHHKDQGANIVIKSSKMACEQLTSKGCHFLPKCLPELDFLKTCFWCKKQLSPCKDVYMYRGEQGFCSKECRSRQILVDERREFEMATRERSINRPHHHRFPGTRVPRSDRSRRIPAIA